MARLTYSKNGLSLTESFEGCKLVAYADPLRNGIPTVGYGHTGSDVHVGSVWTQAQCEAALASDIQWASNVVNNLVTVELTQNEFDAVVDLVFNIGAGHFAKSTELKLLNNHQFEDAAVGFEAWKFASGVAVAGLLRRRLAEENLFKTPDAP
jgi:lysozyme